MLTNKQAGILKNTGKASLEQPLLYMVTTILEFQWRNISLGETSFYDTNIVVEQKLSLGKAKMKVLVAQLCLTLCNPMDCSPPGSSVHGTLQGRILE